MSAGEIGEAFGLQVPVAVPRWILEAERKLGQREIAGGKDNSFIVECLRRVGIPHAHDETAWCAALVNYCLEEAGLRGTGLAAARSYLGYGTKLAAFRPFCIAVFDRVDPDHPTVPHGHVAFPLCELTSHVVTLGGNQGNSVSIEARGKDKLLGYFWPPGVP